ncbi:MAG: hypothetical protein PH343_06465, partial [Nitrospira sp.]|nr:hypothetical protein [Nitrospira sp.]
MNRTLWLLVSVLVTTGLLLASCGTEAPATTSKTAITTTTKTTTSVTTTSVPITTTTTETKESPQYGGTFITVTEPQSTAGFDEIYSSTSKSYTLSLTNENLLKGDWAKGPAGSNQTDFWESTVAPQVFAPAIVTSYEVPDPSTIILHIRKGIHYGLNSGS